MRCYIFDLDGTLCDISHRLHFIVQPPTCDVLMYNPAPPWKKDWDSFYAACVGDKPIEAMCRVAGDLSKVEQLVFVSGRSDVVRRQTERWIYQYVVPASYVPLHLYMRKDGDHRPDFEVKAEMLDDLLSRGYQPIMAFDDRKQVVDMWRSRGIVCAQVADGDF